MRKKQRSARIEQLGLVHRKAANAFAVAASARIRNLARSNGLATGVAENGARNHRKRVLELREQGALKATDASGSFLRPSAVYQAELCRNATHL